MNWIRLGIAVALAAGVAGVVWIVRPTSDAPARAASPFIADHRKCAECHADVFAEWEASRHAATWESPVVQAAFQSFGNDRKCQSCHAPEPVFLTGLAVAESPRAEDRESGVNCLTCHALADGVAARRSLPGAPCRPVERPEIADARACAGCHDTIHADWQASGFAGSEGKNCVGCHMPPGKGGRRSHHFLGGFDRPMLDQAARLEVKVAGANLLVSVTNVGAGHNFPGERHTRELYVEAVQRDPSGTIISERRELIKGLIPFRGETSADRIKSGETVTVSFAVAPNAAAGEVALIYKTRPWSTDAQAFRLLPTPIHFRKESGR